jgi:hypothetical protein
MATRQGKKALQRVVGEREERKRLIGLEERFKGLPWSRPARALR